jgi:hypothetical protein
MCGQTRKWHNNNTVRHPFNATAASLNEKPRIVAESPEYGIPPHMREQPSIDLRRATLIDPVLRMALVNAGVITVEQIDAAQRISDTLNGVAHESTHFTAPDNDG